MAGVPLASIDKLPVIWDPAIHHWSPTNSVQQQFKKLLQILLRPSFFYFTKTRTRTYINQFFVEPGVISRVDILNYLITSNRFAFDQSHAPVKWKYSSYLVDQCLIFIGDYFSGRVVEKLMNGLSTLLFPSNWISISIQLYLGEIISTSGLTFVFCIRDLCSDTPHHNILNQ